MVSEPIALQGVKPVPNERLIALLEILLKEVKAGELQGAAIAGAYTNLRTCNIFETGEETMLLLAEMRILERDLMDAEVDLRKPPCELE